MPAPFRLIVVVLSVLAVGALVSACQRAVDAGSARASASPARDNAGYFAPPELTAAARHLDGGVSLRGRAPPSARVELAAPDGTRIAAVADAGGAWSMTVPVPQGQPAMYAFSATLGARALKAEGAVLLAPPPGPAALLVRAGYAALTVGGPEAAPRVVALDYDVGGAAAVAGFASPRAEVRLSLDGRPAGLDQADASGRFGVLASNAPLAPGSRRLQVEANGVRTELSAQVSPAQPLAGSPFRAIRQGGAWRIDWAPSGGGVQTTLVFDEPAASGPEGRR